MSTFLNAMKDATNFTLTENGALTHKTTRSDLLDMFAMGAAYRSRSDADVLVLFRKAFQENPVYAMKCLFYIRDVRGGQGERRFFRVCMRDLAAQDLDAAKRNLTNIPEYGRWDDLLVFIGTPLENDALAVIKSQLVLDVQCKTPSLLAKWLPSENTSSAKTRAQAAIVRKYLGWTHKQYRKVLSTLRARINVLERLMSAGRWDEIEFDKIPSRAGMIYKNAFARHDIERMKSEKLVVSYADFAKDTTTKVNAKALYPYECVAEAMKVMGCNEHSWWSSVHRNVPMDDTNRLMVNKYWANLADYFNGASFDGICVVDTSSSMTWGGGLAIQVATSLGLYCAEKAKGPFAGHYISFSRNPRLVQTDGVDFCDKVDRIVRADLCENTNIKGVFDLMLNTARTNHMTQADLPKNVIVISDMEFDNATGYAFGRGNSDVALNTLFENIAREWAMYGYEMPSLIFWNVNARQNNIPMLGNGPISYVSGFSPAIFETIMTGKTGYDLMMEKLDSPRYEAVR